MAGLADDFRDLPALLTPKQVAAVLQLSLTRIYHMKCDGTLPGVVLLSASSFRVRKSSLIEWLRQKLVPSLEG